MGGRNKSVSEFGLGELGSGCEGNEPTERLPTMASFRCLASVDGIYTVSRRREGVLVGGFVLGP